MSAPTHNDTQSPLQLGQLQNSPSANQSSLVPGSSDKDVVLPSYDYSSQSGDNGSQDARALKAARFQFEFATSERRGRSRGFDEETDFLDAVSSGDEDMMQNDPEYRDYVVKRDKYRDSVQQLRDVKKGGQDSSVDDLNALMGSQAFLGAAVPEGIIGDDASASPSKVKRASGRPPGPQPRKGRNTGPRKAAPPTPDIRLRLGRGNASFLDENYDEALAIVSEIIRINAETYEAWTLLAAIFKEIRQLNNAIMALMIAAHLRPKEIASWMNCARMALDDSGDDRPRYMPSAQFCYSQAIRYIPDSMEAHYGKGQLYLERGHLSGALTQFKRVLEAHPHDLGLIRQLAEIYIDLEEPAAGINMYKSTIAHLMDTTGGLDSGLDWNHVDDYGELYACAGLYHEAVKQASALSRWLLGRQEEEFWDRIVIDCEWDADDSRRIEISEFIPHRFAKEFYGMALPIELRAKFGLWRIRAGQTDEAKLHFDWLLKADDIQHSMVLNYFDLLMDLADKLSDLGQYETALMFYEHLKKVPENMDARIFVKMGICFLRDEQDKRAEGCFQTAVHLDPENIDARMELARMYEKQDEPEQAFTYASEVLSLRKHQQEHNKDKGISKNLNAKGIIDNDGQDPSTLYRSTTNSAHKLKQRMHQSKADFLSEQFIILNQERDGMRAEDSYSRGRWLEAARELTEDFRSLKQFYPSDRSEFRGYYGDARLQAEANLHPDAAAMANRIAEAPKSIEKALEQARAEATPKEYRGVSFDEWLDIFLEYAICLARLGRLRESIDICQAAGAAVVYSGSRDSTFVIKLCECLCGLLCNDEDTCVGTARFLMFHYQFTTDSYRLFAAVTRMCHSPVSWYSSGPTQKFILRQIKAMDYALVDEGLQKRYYGEKASYTAVDHRGETLVNKDFDIALLMIYGHILFSGSSFAIAMNYFFRAYALDPENPTINLSIGLAYLHHSLKRQSENRQHGILQALTFMHKYYDIRKDDERYDIRQEAHYNMARAYHLLGMVHLALPYYRKVMNAAGERGSGGREDVLIDTAYNLQTIYAMAGNMELAASVTRKWLVI